ncbi:putative cyclase [Irpex rosettiformis]|uniref:Cyclase n=1 Tax=Irpex rosettiformis TaxID=378272 RepID=A0ACB8TYG3_9APHY|nr:putative cyclase [Irpex rosettiformis]
MGEIIPAQAALQQSNDSPKRTIIDLTHPLVSSEVPACDGHPKYAVHCLSHLSRGDVATCHSLTMGTHTGTHVDAPYHFVEDGITVDKLDLTLLTAAPAVVADLRWKKAREPIRWEDLGKYENQLRDGVALLLCTGWSSNWKRSNYSEHPFLDVEAAKKIMEKGVRVIGLDTMSPDEVAEEGDTGRVHRIWLGDGGIIVENMNGLERLLEVSSEADLRVSLLPLRLVDCDGSPIRAVAWKEHP